MLCSRCLTSPKDNPACITGRSAAPWLRSTQMCTKPPRSTRSGTTTGSRSETAGQQGVRNANVSPRNCLPRNVARKKTSAGRDIETRHAPQPTLRPTFALAIGVANRDGSCHRPSQPPPRVVPLASFIIKLVVLFLFHFSFSFSFRG